MSEAQTPAHDTTNDYDLQRRFGGVARTYGTGKLQRFMQAHVCIIGTGGVGSWAVEALARSGIGELTLIDLDNVAESNINRQLPALTSTIGMAKIEVLRQRIVEINPACKVNLVEDFVEVGNIQRLILSTDGHQYDYVIDCIDNFRIKSALIAYCRRNKIPIITVGGAGGQCDPTKIRLTDLARSLHDPLLSRVRKQLRQKYGFSRNPKRRFEVASIWSEEQMVFPNISGGVTREKPESAPAEGLSCAGGIGSMMTVTASFALFAVSHVLNKL